MPKRPAGLTFFAIVNFIFGGVALHSLIISLLLPAEYPQFSVPATPYNIIALSLTGTLLVVSGFGFLKLHYKMGFLVGSAFCLLSIANVLAMEGFAHITKPKLIYPVILFITLNVKYKLYFTGEAKTTEKTPS